ncbi:hypothetical protein OG558_23935 [Kribbella sp. NBC_01510]|uniref:hypothetical protein n=1 Tax=Kribbella sp. NBC_01510 TaxID=2903581 RepID=UPI00386DB900
MDDVPLVPAALPGIVAGPVLRRVTRTKASVWIAVSRPDPVTLLLRIANQPETEIAAATVTPTRVGRVLWLAVLTGGSPVGGTFAAGVLYEYRLTSVGWPEPNWAEVAIGSLRPAFPGPPATIEELVLIHTSCRKVHGNGRDGLAEAHAVIQERIATAQPSARPHLLVMSGDQIYADEVPSVLVPRIRRISQDLVDVDDAAPFLPLPRIGGRQQPSEAHKLTSSAADNHLWLLGEFLATYLLYWSDVLWPAVLPAWTDVIPGTDLDPAAQLDEGSWNEQRDVVSTFRAGLASVRKVLATVPSMMVLDDHEVTDDWNLDYAWTAAVYPDPAGTRVVSNGLLAYLVCQHWGNVPERFAAAGTPEAAALAAAVWTGSSPDSPATRALLGLPIAAPPAPPSVLRDLTVPGALRYDFELGPGDGWPVRLIGLDERTVREFHRVDHPPGRTSVAALGMMLPGPAGLGPADLTVIVTPSPALGTHVIEHDVQPASGLLPGGAIYTDFESWSGATANHQELLRRVGAYGPVLLLGGDVHFGGTARSSYTRLGITSTAAMVTSSSAHNADAKTMVLHLLGDLAMRLGIERPRTQRGYLALSAADRSKLAAAPPAGASLPYDDLTDVLLGRVFRAGQETPAVIAEDVAAAYGLPAGDWTYTVVPVDDQTLPPAGPLANDMATAPAPAWPTWDPVKSYQMVKALRAGDLHRVGRMFVGLPQFSMLEFSNGPLTVHHHLIAPVGDASSDTGRHHADVSVVMS